MRSYDLLYKRNSRTWQKSSVFQGFQGLEKTVMNFKYFQALQWSIRTLWEIICPASVTLLASHFADHSVLSRWLSAYDVSIETLWMRNVYTLFYYAFLQKQDKVIYKDVIKAILDKNELSEPARHQLNEVWTELVKIKEVQWRCKAVKDSRLQKDIYIIISINKITKNKASKTYTSWNLLWNEGGW